MRPNLRWSFLTVVHGFNAFTALLGGGALALWPDGSALRAPMSLLEGTPFKDFFVPGLVLFFAVGVMNLIAALGARARKPGAEVFSFAAGLVTLGWIIGEALILRVFSPLQVVFVFSGLLLMADAIWIRLQPRSMRHA